MAPRLKIEEHLELGEVKRRYQQEKDVVARRQWQVIWLLQSGHPSEEVAQVVGLSQDWVRTLARRYNSGGPSAVGDGRHHGQGKAPLLDEAGLQALRAALEQPVPEELGGGLWNGPKVWRWLELRLGRKVPLRCGNTYLHKAGYSVQSARPRHLRASAQEQAAFKKS